MKKTTAFLVLLLGISFVFGQNATDQGVTLQANYVECSPEYGLTVNTNQYEPDFITPINTLEFDVAVSVDAVGNITTIGDAPTGYYDLGISYNIACSNTAQEITVSILDQLEGIAIRGADNTNPGSSFNISTSAVTLASGLQSSGYVNLGLSAELDPGSSITSTGSQSATLIITMIND